MHPCNTASSTEQRGEDAHILASTSISEWNAQRAWVKSNYGSRQKYLAFAEDCEMVANTWIRIATSNGQGEIMLANTERMCPGGLLPPFEKLPCKRLKISDNCTIGIAYRIAYGEATQLLLQQP